MKTRYLMVMMVMLCLGVGMGMANSAQAAITSASVNPATRTISTARNVPLSLTWSIRTTGGVTATVESETGFYLINGAQVRSTAALPTQTKTSGVALNAFMFTFTETISVPADLIRRAQEGGQALVYSRRFSDDGFATDTTLTVTMNFSNPGIGSALEVTRLRLGFEGGAPICNAQTGDDIVVTAFVDADGTGTLRGNWQVRDTLKSSSFRTVRTVQMPVTATRNVKLQSPPIPTNGSGRMDVRFQITSPAVAFDAPVVSCIVAGSDKVLLSYQPVGRAAEVTAPAGFMPLHAQTRIEWRAVDGARAYRIEIFAEENGRPVAAQQVKAEDLTATLSPLTLAKLDAARRYLVRVYAE